MERRYYDRELETMSRKDLLAWQWKELKKQIDYTYAKSGLCQRQFKQAKITPDDINNLQDFVTKVPITDKMDYLEDQKMALPYGTRLGVAENDIHLTTLTSGTSGRGQEAHPLTKADLDFYLEGVKMSYTWGGWEQGDRVMNPLPISTTKGGNTRFQALQRMGINAFTLGTYDTKTKLDYMQRFKINAMNAGAAYLTALTNEAIALGMDPAKDLYVRKIMMAGSAYPVSFVTRMEQTWNAKIYDYYGATQYALGVTCENGAAYRGQRGVYHLYEHIAVHEIVNPDTLEPVNPGEEGEVIVTPLFREASPCLRFRMRDRVRLLPRDSCDCGRPFALCEAGTVARYDDMIRIKGMNIWPEMVDEVVLNREGALEYKGRVFITEEGKEKVEIYVELKNDITQQGEKATLKVIQDELSKRTGVTFIVKRASQPLPRYVTKATSLRWNDERIKGLEKKAMDRG